MAFCPKCLYEIVRGPKFCPECGARLVRRLSPQQMAEVQWTLVGSFSDVTQANMVKEALENQGITALLKTDMFHSALMVQGTAFPGAYAHIFVPRAKCQEALDSIKTMTGK